MDYSKLTFTLDTRCITFEQCIMAASEFPELSFQIDRLFGTHIIQICKSRGINKLIDEATGFQETQLKNFIAFVYEYVWKRLDPKLKFTSPAQEQMLYQTLEQIVRQLESNTS